MTAGITATNSNIQKLADAYCQVDRTVPSETNKLDFAKVGEDTGMAALWTLGPTLAMKGINGGPEYFAALMKWRNDPRCSTFQQAYDKVLLEKGIQKQNLSFLSQDANGNKYGRLDRYKYKTTYSHMNEMFNKLPALNEQMPEPTTMRGKIWNNVKEFSTYNNAKRTRIANNKILNEQKELKELRQLLKEVKDGKIPANQLKAHYQKVLAKMQEFDLKVNELKMKETIKPTTLLGKVGHAIKKGTGYYNAKGFMLKSTKGFKALKCLGKFGKGAGVFAAVGAILSETGEVMGAREIDKIERAKGNKSNRMQKQIGKSAVVAGCTIAGSVAAASAAGALIGTAVCPLIGTAIGFAAGAIGGLIGGWLGKKMTGKSEVEKYQEEQQAKATQQANELAQQAAGDKDVKDELLGALWQAKESGELTDEQIIAALEEEVAAREQELATAVPQQQATSEDYRYKIFGAGPVYA